MSRAQRFALNWLSIAVLAAAVITVAGEMALDAFAWPAAPVAQDTTASGARLDLGN